MLLEEGTFDALKMIMGESGEKGFPRWLSLALPAVLGCAIHSSHTSLPGSSES